jgi:hypothetical protein
MKNILRLFAIALTFAALNAHARGNVPILNHDAVQAVTGAGKPASPEQIRTALQAAGSPRGWTITPAGNGKALAVLDVRGKHTVSADITYASGQYSIKYRDSSNMNYEAGSNSIHPKYNMWVDQLVRDTRAQLAK